MSGRIEYPHIPEGTVSPQLKSELRKLVDQINRELSELDSRITKQNQAGGSANGKQEKGRADRLPVSAAESA